MSNDTASVLSGEPSLTTLATTNSAVGGYTIAAAQGSLSAANYILSFTNGTLTVNKAAPALALASSSNPAEYGSPVVFTATGPTDATGSVVFSSPTGPLSTNHLTGGQVDSLAVTNLASGTNRITASYSGDGNYYAATNTLDQVIAGQRPVARIMTVPRNPGARLQIAVSDLATNWTDANGSTVSLLAVNLQTTNGVTLSLINLKTNGGGVYVITNTSYLGYRNSLNINDQFSYTIINGLGITNVGKVNIVIQSTPVGTSSITRISGGNPNLLTAYGVPGLAYITERSTNLTTWAGIATNAASTNGVINVTDSFSDLNSNTPPAAYYRLKWSGN
jgi:hypothetical protein